MRFAEETHRLPIPPDAIGEVNYETVISNIISFLSVGFYNYHRKIDLLGREYCT